MSVRKINKSWYVDFRYNRSRYRIKSPDSTKSGTQAYESLIRQKLARGETIIEQLDKNQTFEEFSKKWFETYVINNNKPSEQRQKKYILRLHLNPIFGKVPLNQIPIQLIEQYKSIKIKSGLAGKTINNHLAILAKCLNTALEWEIIDKTPRIKKLKIPPYESEFLSHEECEHLLSHAEGVWYEMIFLGIKTGLRLGEITGLDWSSLNFKDRILTVKQALVRNMIVSPKSNKIRHVPMTNELCELFSKRKQNKGYVFTDENGDFLKAERCRRNMHFICKKADIKNIKWHTLRHTFASHLIQLGAHQIEVQRLLGHSDIQTTMRYAHLAPSSLRKAIDLLEPKEENINFGQYMGKQANITFNLSNSNGSQ